MNAAHELGAIPPDHAAMLRHLSQRHRLVLLSNLWSAPGPWLEAFARAGIARVFEVMVFSSQTSSIKPSPLIFQRLLAEAGVPAAEAVYIGDDPTRDIAGAKAAGLTTIWLAQGRAADPALGADRDIESLLDLGAL